MSYSLTPIKQLPLLGSQLAILYCFYLYKQPIPLKWPLFVSPRVRPFSKG